MNLRAALIQSLCSRWFQATGWESDTWKAMVVWWALVLFWDTGLPWMIPKGNWAGTWHERNRKLAEVCVCMYNKHKFVQIRRHDAEIHTHHHLWKLWKYKETLHAYMFKCLRIERRELVYAMLQYDQKTLLGCKVRS